MSNELDEEVTVSPELVDDHSGGGTVVIDNNKTRPSINDIGEYATTDLGLGPAWGPFKYRKLPEPFLTEELARLSLARTLGNANDVDVVSFQPSLNESDRSQDRYVVEDWAMITGHGDGEDSSSEFWSFRCVFDGHAGHETVDYASEHLLPLIKASLFEAFNASADATIPPSPEFVSKLLSDAVVQFDNSIANAVLDLFPGAPESLDSISDEQIREVINDGDRGGVNLIKVLRCMRGTTALIAVLDPKRDNLWVAGLGDCSAVLCTTELNNGEDNIAEETALLLTSHHNGKNIEEAGRIKEEHPGETECLLRNRVLGSIAITRALGDHLFKLPAVYTKRIFMNSAIAFQFSSAPVTDILPRIISPPYLSNIPDVQHVNLKSYLAYKQNAFLVLCSDGLTDVFSNEGESRPIQDVADVFPSVLNRSVALSDSSNETQNLALSLLREGLGGEDKDRVSSLLTLELESKWIDDVTVVVQRL